MSLDLTSNDPQFIFIMDKQCEGTVYAFSGFRLDADHLMLYRGAEEVSLPPKAIETYRSTFLGVKPDAACLYRAKRLEKNGEPGA